MRWLVVSIADDCKCGRGNQESSSRVWGAIGAVLL